MAETRETPPPLSAPEAIQRRRTTRRFDGGRDVPDATLAAILRLATLAPSRYNLQPWRFLVVRAPRSRERLRAAAFGSTALAEAPVAVVLLAYLDSRRTHLGTIVEQGEARGAATPAEAAEWRARAARDRGLDSSGWAPRTAMLAAATLMIAAESLGVSSRLVEPFDPDRLREGFGVPDDHEACALIALGHAAEPAPFPGRLPLAEVAFVEHFGQPWPADEPPSPGTPRDPWLPT